MSGKQQADENHLLDLFFINMSILRIYKQAASFLQKQKLFIPILMRDFQLKPCSKKNNAMF